MKSRSLSGIIIHKNHLPHFCLYAFDDPLEVPGITNERIAVLGDGLANQGASALHSIIILNLSAGRKSPSSPCELHYIVGWLNNRS